MMRETKPTNVMLWWLRIVAVAIALGGLSPDAALAQDSGTAACAELVSKLTTLKARLLPSGGGSRPFVNMEAVGLAAFVRENNGNPTIFHSMLSPWVPPASLPAGTPPPRFHFTMDINGDPGFNGAALSGKASMLFSDGYQKIGFAFLPSTGGFQWQSYTWAPGISNRATAVCTKIGQAVLPSAPFKTWTTVAERTVPIVQVDAIEFFSGYGSDSFHLLLKPAAGWALD